MNTNKNWEYKRISDVCSIERGGSPRPIDSFITDDPDGINWIKIGDTDDSMFITHTAQKIIPEGMKKSRYVQPGDFLLSNSMSFGRPYILKIDGCIHDGWLVLRDNDNTFDKRFLYYYLSAKPTYEKFKRMAVGGVVNNLNSEMVRKVDVPVPKLEEQSSIADLLDKINLIITERKKELKHLDELIKARFVEMFIDKGYAEVTIKDIIADSFWLMPATPEFIIDGSVPYITSKNIKNRTIDFENVKYISEAAYENISANRPIKVGDILVSMIGTLGQTAVILDDREFYGQNLYLLRLNKQIIDTDYFCEFFNSDRAQHELQGQRNQSTQAYLKANHVENLKLPLPPIDIQKQFSVLVKQVDKSKFIN